MPENSPIPRTNTLRHAILVGLIIWSAGCGENATSSIDYTAIPAGEVSFVASDGLTRSYDLHLPSGLNPDQPVPLVLAFHGVGHNGVGMRALTRLDAIANDSGFVVAYPYGLGEHMLDNGWSIEGLRKVSGIPVDDLAFVRDLIDHVDRQQVVDRARVYAIGLSNGGAFVYTLGCELPDELAGGALMSGGVAQNCSGVRPFKLAIIHGTLDNQFPWSGVARQGIILLHSAQGSQNWWAEHNGCQSEPVRDTLPDIDQDGILVERRQYLGCAPGGSLLFYGVLGGGHSWPGEDPRLPNTSQDFDATAIIIDFLLSR